MAAMSNTEEHKNNSTNGDLEKTDKQPWLHPYRFKPGESGNPGGRPKGTVSIETELKRRLADGESGDDIVQQLVSQALAQALDGDYKFFNMILERIDGRVADRLAGHDGGPLFTEDDMERLTRLAKQTDEWRD